jgi:hypothetical protein
MKIILILLLITNIGNAQVFKHVKNQNKLVSVEPDKDTMIIPNGKYDQNHKRRKDFTFHNNVDFYISKVDLSEYCGFKEKKIDKVKCVSLYTSKIKKQYIKKDDGYLLSCASFYHDFNFTCLKSYIKIINDRSKNR